MKLLIFILAAAAVVLIRGDDKHAKKKTRKNFASTSFDTIQTMNIKGRSKKIMNAQMILKKKFKKKG